jgi:acetoin utilization protein AcuC
MRRAAFVYDEIQSAHVLRDDHVFKPGRLQLTYELLKSYGAFDDSKPVKPRMADEADLLLFHNPDYVSAIRDLSIGSDRRDALDYNISHYGDNPPYNGMYEVSALVVGASLAAADLVTSDRADVAFNISGGLHHAMPARASGFCIFNDAAIVTKHLVNQGYRVAYVDIDAHHGDGVQNAFYESNEVLTISLHESGRYLFPGTGDTEETGNGAGKGYSVNIPLFPKTDDEIYLWAFREIVPPLIKAFKPDVLVTQLGCDTYYMDPLTDIMLTTDGYTKLVKELGKLVPKWVALGGGGYDMDAVVRLWSLAYGIMLEREWPDEIPADFQKKYGIKRLRDADKPHVDDDMLKMARQFAKQSVDEIKRMVFPIHSLKS